MRKPSPNVSTSRKWNSTRAMLPIRRTAIDHRRKGSPSLLALPFCSFQNTGRNDGLFPHRALELTARRIKRVREADAVCFSAAQKRIRSGKALCNQVYVLLTRAIRDIQPGGDHLVQETSGAVGFTRRCEQDTLQLRGIVRRATDRQPAPQN